MCPAQEFAINFYQVGVIISFSEHVSHSHVKRGCWRAVADTTENGILQHRCEASQRWKAQRLHLVANLDR
jgi:hypothetical protein